MLRRVGGRWIRWAFRLALVVPVLASIGLPAQADPVFRPRPNEVCLFSGINFEGVSSCVAAGILNVSLAAVFNDRVSSIRIGNGAAIEVCGEAFFGGWCQLYRSDVAELPVEQNNAITSYRVMTLPAAEAILVAQAEPPAAEAVVPPPPPDGAAPAPDTGQLVPVAAVVPPVVAQPRAPLTRATAAVVGVDRICFFSEPNFGGESFCASPGDTTTGVSAFWDDRISSIRVEGKVAVQVCQLRDFFGWCERVESSVAQLPAGRNDAISSFRFQ